MNIADDEDLSCLRYADFFPSKEAHIEFGVRLINQTLDGYSLDQRRCGSVFARLEAAYQNLWPGLRAKALSPAESIQEVRRSHGLIGQGMPDRTGDIDWAAVVFHHRHRHDRLNQDLLRTHSIGSGRFQLRRIERLRLASLLDHW